MNFTDEAEREAALKALDSAIQGTNDALHMTKWVRWVPWLQNKAEVDLVDQLNSLRIARRVLAEVPW